MKKLQEGVHRHPCQSPLPLKLSLLFLPKYDRSFAPALSPAPGVGVLERGLSAVAMLDELHFDFSFGNGDEGRALLGEVAGEIDGGLETSEVWIFGRDECGGDDRVTVDLGKYPETAAVLGVGPVD